MEGFGPHETIRNGLIIFNDHIAHLVEGYLLLLCFAFSDAFVVRVFVSKNIRIFTPFSMEAAK